MNPSRFIGWLYDHGGQQVEVELINGKTYRGELSVYDEDSDHIRLRTDTTEAIPLSAIARVKPLSR
jgi:ribosome maturation factor RimP